MEETPQAVILVTPYVRTGDLWDQIRYGDTVYEAEGRNFLAQVMQGLDIFHNQLSLVHGDIKPHNMLLRLVEGKFVVQLCDFGLTEAVDHSSRLIHYTGLRGTSGYFAPEMLSQLDYGFGIDVFALGVTLFRMLVGYEPFYPPSNFETPVFEPQYWSHISEDCKHLLRCMLELNPSARISVGDALQHPWLVKRVVSNEAPAGYGAPPNENLKFYDPSGQIPFPFNPDER
eukprot:g17609.t1